MKNRNTFIALTALWAFVESGLGGIMHAFHLPFTGIFLGGFSVLIISLIAHFEAKPFRQILKATLIVMAIKASVNPMTSPMAYIAVGFQGLCGAAIYSLPYRNAGFSILFAVLAMLESALQKLLILTIIFGKVWMEALDAYFHSMVKNFGMDGHTPFSYRLIALYLSIYSIWGLLLGIWVHKLPKQILIRSERYNDLQPASKPEAAVQRKKHKRLFIFLLITALIVMYTFFIPESRGAGQGLITLFRTAAIVLIWMALIMPLWRRWIQAWLNRRKQAEMPEVLSLIPTIASYVRPLYDRLNTQYKGAIKWKEFALGLIVISLKQDGKA